MGNWFTYILWGGDPDSVNPLSGLSKRDIHAVRKSWAPVYANHVANGTELLKRLFKAHPETRDFFKMVRNLPEEDYTKCPQFQAHVINLMTALNMAINNLHRPDIVEVMMMKLGESHGKRRIKEKNFHDLKEVIVAMFIEVLKLDSATLGSWSKTVDFWYRHLFTTLNAAGAR